MAERKTTLGKTATLPSCKFKKGDKVVHLDTEIPGVIYLVAWGKAEKKWYVSMVDEHDNEYIGKEKDFKKR